MKFEDHKFADGIGIKFVALRLLVGQHGDNATRVPGTKVWAYMESYIRQNVRIAAPTKFMAEVHINDERTDLHKVSWDDDILPGQVTLLPVLNGTVTSVDELKALVKYYFLLAEKAKLHGYDRHWIAVNQTLVGVMKKICRQAGMVVTEINERDRRIRRVRYTAPRQHSTREECAEDARMSGTELVMESQTSTQVGASHKRAASEALVPTSSKRQQVAVNRLASAPTSSPADASSSAQSYHFLPPQTLESMGSSESPRPKLANRVAIQPAAEGITVSSQAEPSDGQHSVQHGARERLYCSEQHEFWMRTVERDGSLRRSAMRVRERRSGVVMKEARYERAMTALI